MIAVALAGMVIASAAFVGRLLQPQPCCSTNSPKQPYVALYDRRLSQVDAVLGEGDGQAFAALAQDPLMQRPSVMAGHGEYAYRAQRPVWGYLTWMGSVGQPALTGWVLAALTILSCGLASALVGLLLRSRGTSAWWALLVPVFATRTLLELTPELLALGLFVAGVLWWERERRGVAVLAFAAAALTRETMLVGVAAVAAWSAVHWYRSVEHWVRRLAPLVAPFAAYAAWVVVLRLRVGSLPFDASHGRLGAPGVGFISSLSRPGGTQPLMWALVGAGVCTAAVWLARRDLLTWIAVAYLAFASLLGDHVWTTNSGFTRALLPLYAAAPVALLGGISVRRRQAVPVRSASATALGGATP
jgi:hypothetical protein